MTTRQGTAATTTAIVAGRRIGVLLLPALLAVAGCEHIADPWVSGSQYAQERERPATRADTLRQRAITVQADR